MSLFVNTVKIVLAFIVGTIFVGVFIKLIGTEIANEFKARVRLNEKNEKKRLAKQKQPTLSTQVKT